MSLLIAAILGVVAVLVVTAPGIYFGLSYLAVEQVTSHEQAVTPYRAIAIAVLGTFVWAIIHVFFGWIPVIGLALPPLAWIVIVKRYTPTDWPAAVVVGLLAWIPSGLAYRGVEIIAF